MSIGGPSASGTLLVQRLDAMLGTTLSQQTNLVSGARPDAVTQPDNPARPGIVQNETARHPREAVDKTLSQTEQQTRQTVEKSKIDTQRSILLTARGTPSTDSTPSAPTTLGNAAKTILALLTAFPDRAPAITGKAPLIQTSPTTQGTSVSTPISLQATATPTVSVPSLIQALSQALQNSGLFYEAHLNNLAFGKQTLQSLQQEPQASLGRTQNASEQTTTRSTSSGLHNTQATTPTSQTHTSSTATAGTITTREPTRADNLQANSLQHQAGSQQASQMPSPSGLHPETHLLVRQQLEVLANQIISWQGQAWPNAPMQWQVQREATTPNDEQPDTLAHWATQLKINLPNLGEVQARLNLVGQHVVMQLVAPRAADLLNENGEALRAHFLASGLQLSQLSIAAQNPSEPSDAEGHDD